jgi:hypothetical protein
VHIDKVSGLADAVPVLLIVIVIVTVIGGHSRLTRGGITSTLPFPGGGTLKFDRIVVGLAIVGAACILLDAQWALSIATIFAVATLLLSLVVVIGYAGQLSLGQAAFAGFGAWLAAKFLLEARRTARALRRPGDAHHGSDGTDRGHPGPEDTRRHSGHCHACPSARSSSR